MDLNLDNYFTHLEARARRANLSMTRACKLAGIWPSTWTRWKFKRTDPRLTLVRSLEDVIAAAEKGRRKGSAAE